MVVEYEDRTLHSEFGCLRHLNLIFLTAALLLFRQAELHVHTKALLSGIARNTISARFDLCLIKYRKKITTRVTL